MNNVIEIGGEKAVIAFDPEIQMLRGEFVRPIATLFSPWEGPLLAHLANLKISRTLRMAILSVGIGSSQKEEP